MTLDFVVRREAGLVSVRAVEWETSLVAALDVELAIEEVHAPLRLRPRKQGYGEVERPAGKRSRAH